MEFEFFDPDSQVDITFRDLPHWFQPGATYFVTFRTADSLPAAAIEKLELKRREWLAVHGIDTNIPVWKSALEKLPRKVQIEYHRMFKREFQLMLDSGYGACVLRRPEAARIVSDAILHFNGARYHVSDFVVMPNHVHVLFGLIGEHELSDVCYSWKRFTATRINRLIGTRGHFWQGESFDHLVRSEEQFAYFRGYIASNPIVAKLGPNESLLYRQEPERWMQAGVSDRSDFPPPRSGGQRSIPPEAINSSHGSSPPPCRRHRQAVPRRRRAGRRFRFDRGR